MASKGNRLAARRKQDAREAARRAALERRRRQRRLRNTLVGGGLSLALLAALALALRDTGSSTALDASSKTTATTNPDDPSASDPSASDPTASTQPALASVKGKPCVAVKDPLPTGAPEVPVQVGPPPTTLIVKDLKEGTGAVVAATDTLTVDYIGVSCSTGAIFDSSYSRGEPAMFGLDRVIAGWTQGLPGMKVGGSRLLGIPSDLAYGPDGGGGGTIAPDEPLWFVVDVKDAKPASAASTPGTPAPTPTSAAG